MPRVTQPAPSPAATAATSTPEPAWRQRAIDRSTQSARQRAAKRVQRFLNSAREIIAEKDSTEFTVQEVVDRSKQSLRSFYQYFDGKHELLLSLFEEEMDLAVTRLKDATAEGDPLVRLHVAVLLLYDLCSPGRTSVQPPFFDFAQRYSPLVAQFAAIVEDAAEAGLLRAGKPRRQAAIVLQTATVTAGRTTGERQPVTGEEVWEFCLHAIATDEVAAKYQATVQPTANGKKRS
jgi:AcrR family transcriptional regulator